MAKGRMLNRTIATDARLNSLDISSQWLFMRMLPFADDHGRLTGNLTELRLQTIPGVSISEKKIEQLLAKLASVGLIRYQVGVGIQYAGWKKNQKIGHRPRTSDIPEIEGEAVPITTKPLVKKSKSKYSSVSDITKKEIEELQNKFPQVDVEAAYERFVDYIESSGKTYKNYYAALRNQCRNDWAPKRKSDDKVVSYIVCPNCDERQVKKGNVPIVCPKCEKDIMLSQSDPEFKRKKRLYATVDSNSDDH